MFSNRYITIKYHKTTKQAEINTIISVFLYIQRKEIRGTNPDQGFYIHEDLLQTTFWF